MKPNIRKISVSLEASAIRHRQIGNAFGIPSSNGSKKKGKRKCKTKPQYTIRNLNINYLLKEKWLFTAL